MRTRRLTPRRRSRICKPAPDPVQTELSEHELLTIQHTSYHQALNQAWFATALEQTKSVFTLASAGVGLALTLIYSGQMKDLCSSAPICLLLAAIAFALSAWFCIWVFRVNGRLVGKLLRDEDSSTEDGLVGRLDMTSRCSFGAGLVFLVLAAIAQIWL